MQDIGGFMMSQIKYSPESIQRAVTIDDILFNSDGDLNVFNVKRNDDGDLWLNANYDNPGNIWNPDNRWVFAARNFLYFSCLLAGVLI